MNRDIHGKTCSIHKGARSRSNYFLSTEGAENFNTFLSTEDTEGAENFNTFLSTEDTEGRGEHLTAFDPRRDAENGFTAFFDPRRDAKEREEHLNCS